MARFQDIPQFTKSAGYMVNVGLDYLPNHYARYIVHYGLDVCPDFQRGYVWRLEQKIRFVEYMLRGGSSSGLDIYCNSPSWQHGNLGPQYPESWFVLVDGKQRLDAVLGFLNNEFPVFGAYRREYTDRPRMTVCNFRWHVNDLQTREEVLQWYLDLNSGGTVHTEDELTKVRELIKANQPYVKPDLDTLQSQANLSRGVLQEVVEEMRQEEEDRARRAAMPDPAPARKGKRK